MGSIKRGSIVLIRYPFTDLSGNNYIMCMLVEISILQKTLEYVNALIHNSRFDPIPPIPHSLRRTAVRLYI